VTPEPEMTRKVYIFIIVRILTRRCTSNLNLNHTTKQLAAVSVRLKIVTCSTYTEKFTRVVVIAPFLLLSVVIVALPNAKMLAASLWPNTIRYVITQSAYISPLRTCVDQSNQLSRRHLHGEETGGQFAGFLGEMPIALGSRGVQRHPRRR